MSSFPVGTKVKLLNPPDWYIRMRTATGDPRRWLLAVPGDWPTFNEPWEVGDNWEYVHVPANFMGVRIRELIGQEGVVIDTGEYYVPWFLGKSHDIRLGPLHGWWKVDRHKIYLPTAVKDKIIELDKLGDRRLHFALFWNQQLLVERQPGLALLHTGSGLVNRIIWKLCGYD